MKYNIDRMSYRNKKKWVKRYHLLKHHKLSFGTSVELLLLNIMVLCLFLYDVNVNINKWISPSNRLFVECFIDSISILLPIHFSGALNNIGYKIDNNVKYYYSGEIILIFITLIWLLITIRKELENYFVNIIRYVSPILNNSVKILESIFFIILVCLIIFIIFYIMIICFNKIMKFIKFLIHNNNWKIELATYVPIIIMILLIVFLFNDIVVNIYYHFKGYKNMITLLFLFLMFTLDMKAINFCDYSKDKDYNKINLYNLLSTIKELAMGYIIKFTMFYKTFFILFLY